jgi:hypothetical protein
MTAAAIDHDRTIVDWFTVTPDELADLAWCLRGPTERPEMGIDARCEGPT